MMDEVSSKRWMVERLAARYHSSKPFPRRAEEVVVSSQTRRLFVRRVVTVGFPVGMCCFLLATARPVLGIPAFARKYGTSCLTCHVIYPKLNPFGEAFRRNGYRFPGVDSDFVKQDTVSLGQEAYKKMFPKAVWPSSLPASVPIAVGFNGQATFHPDTKSGGALADNGAAANLNDVVDEGHIWAGGSLDDSITFFGEFTVGQDGTELEHSHLHFNDLFGPKHAVNLVVGKFMPTLSSFGMHSSYLADMAITPLLTTALYGATSDSWNVGDSYKGLEFNGVVKGRFDYALGVNAGANVDTRNPNNTWVQVGYKFGGLRLDGEGASGPPDASKPWAEKAVTLDGFYYRSTSRFAAATADILNDGTSTYGAGVRAQWNSFEADIGAYEEHHDHAMADGGSVRALAQYNELSYVVYPWLVPSLRVEYLKLMPHGQPSVTDTRIVAGAAALVRANLKLTLSAWIESASGAPDAGWGPAMGMALPATPQGSVSREVEAVSLGLAYAF
jgi:hypothetical protein